jgi:hypothetical protein
MNRAIAYKPAEKEIDALRLRASYRSRLVKNRVALEVAANEMRRVIKCDPTVRFVYESSMCDMERIKKQINGIEQKNARGNYEQFFERKLSANHLYKRCWYADSDCDDYSYE